MDILFQEPTQQTNDEFITNVKGMYTEPSFMTEMGARWGQGADYHFSWQVWKGIESGDIAFDTPETIMIGENWTTDAYLDEMREKDQISKETWLEKVGHREGLLGKYEEDMTNYQADLLVNRYDERRYRDYILSISPGTLGRQAAGFATVLGMQATDPVNYVPIFGWGRDAGIIGRYMGMQKFLAAYPAKGAFVVGAMDAAAATVLTDAYIIPRLRAEGEEVPWSMLVYDTIAAAGLGGLMSLGTMALTKADPKVKAEAEVDANAAATAHRKRTSRNVNQRYKQAEFDFTRADEMAGKTDLERNFERESGIDEAGAEDILKIDEEFAADNAEFLRDVGIETLDARMREDTQFTQHYDDLDVKTLDSWWEDIVVRRDDGDLSKAAEGIINDVELRISRAEKKIEAIEDLLVSGADKESFKDVADKFDLTVGEVKEIADNILKIQERHGDPVRVAAAINKMMERERLGILRERHSAIVNVNAVDRLHTDIVSRWKEFWQGRKVRTGNKVEKPILEIFEGSERPGVRTQDSIQTVRTGVQANVARKFHKIINKLEGTKEKLIRKWRETPEEKLARKTLERDVRRALEDGMDTIKDPHAKQIALAWREVMHYLHTRARKAGIDIEYRNNYLPHTHDPARILSVEKSKWLEDIQKYIDRDGSFGNIDDAAYEEVLESIYNNIVYGKKIEVTSRMASQKRVAMQHARHRVIKFKNAEMARLYHKYYGRQGESLSHIMSTYIERMARDIAVVERLGPDSRANLVAVMARWTDELRGEGVDSALLDAISARALERKGWGIGAAFDIAHGFADAPVGTKLHVYTRVLRMVANMAFLGRAAITSFVDVAMSAHNLRHMGMGTGEAYKRMFTEVLERITSRKEKREMLDLLGFGMDYMNASIAHRYSAGETNLSKVSTSLGKAEEFFFKWSGLDPWTRLMRETATIVTANHLGNHAHLSYSKLGRRVSDLLDAYGITAKQWDAIRNKGLVEQGGRKFIFAEGLDDDLAEALMRLYHTEGSYAVIMPDVRTRRYLTGGTQPGTGFGEASRMFGQFKSFPAAMTHKVLGRAWYATFEKGDYLNYPSLFAGMFAVGYVARATKDLLDGRTPRNPFDKDTVIDVFVQSGVGGIYTDFVWAAAQNRQAAMLSTVMGPAPNMLIQSGAGVAKATAGIFQGTLDKDMARLGRLGLKHTPLASHFLTKAMLDYGLMFRLEDYYNPGGLRRKERFYKERYGSEYFFPPTDYY